MCNDDIKKIIFYLSSNNEEMKKKAIKCYVMNKRSIVYQLREQIVHASRVQPLDVQNLQILHDRHAAATTQEQHAANYARNHVDASYLDFLKLSPKGSFPVGYIPETSLRDMVTQYIYIHIYHSQCFVFIFRVVF